MGEAAERLRGEAKEKEAKGRGKRGLWGIFSGETRGKEEGDGIS